MENQQPGALEAQIRDTARRKGFSLESEKAYVSWYKRFVKFHLLRHPGEMGKEEVERFLTHLATEQNVAGATQDQGLSALVFLYREVLSQPFEGIDALRAKKAKRVPTVLSADEVGRLLGEMRGGFLNPHPSPANVRTPSAVQQLGLQSPGYVGSISGISGSMNPPSPGGCVFLASVSACWSRNWKSSLWAKTGAQRREIAKARIAHRYDFEALFGFRFIDSLPHRIC